MKNRCIKDVRKYFFSNRVINRWNRLAEDIVRSGINFRSWGTGILGWGLLGLMSATPCLCNILLDLSGLRNRRLWVIWWIFGVPVVRVTLGHRQCQHPIEHIRLLSSYLPFIETKPMCVSLIPLPRYIATLASYLLKRQIFSTPHIWGVAR